MNATMMPWMMKPEDITKAWTDFAQKSAALPRAMEIAKKTRVGITPSNVTFQRDKLKVLHYQTEHERKYETPLLVVFALVNRPYILDLKPGKSVVEHFLKAGFNTFKVDWGVPAPADRHLGMDDYICGYMDDVVDHVREYTGCDKVNILGYCMGGTMSTIYTALHPEKVENLVLMAAPADWSNRNHLLAKWTDAGVFDVDKIVDTFGNAPPELLQSSFMLLKPVNTFVEKYFTFYENVDNEKFLEDFFAMETWLNDNIPVAGEMFREFVKHCMQENRLIKGELVVGDRRVDLTDITCPLLNLVAEKDHLVPCGQSLPLNDAVGSKDRKSISFPAGHIGLAVGSRAGRELWPGVCDWLGERSAKL